MTPYRLEHRCFGVVKQFRMVLWKVANLNIGSPFKGTAVLRIFAARILSNVLFPNAIGPDDCDPVAFADVE